MRPIFILKICLLLVSLSVSALHAQDLAKMSDAQLRSTGVSKLSTSELAALQNWIDAHPKAAPSKAVPAYSITSGEPGSVNTAAIAPMTGAAPTSNYPEPQIARPPVKRDAFDAELSADITELTGATRIRLSNGQVWQQVNSDQWRGSLSHLRVRLKPKFGGSWLMQFKANNMSIRVKRIE
jgi:hypothetical protein